MAIHAHDSHTRRKICFVRLRRTLPLLVVLSGSSVYGFLGARVLAQRVARGGEARPELLMVHTAAYAQVPKNRCILMFLYAVVVPVHARVVCGTPQRAGRSGVCRASRGMHFLKCRFFLSPVLQLYPNAEAQNAPIS